MSPRAPRATFRSSASILRWSVVVVRARVEALAVSGEVVSDELPGLPSSLAAISFALPRSWSTIGPAKRSGAESRDVSAVWTANSTPRLT